MNLIQEYTKYLEDLLQIEIEFRYYLDFSGVHSPEWRELSLNSLNYTKDESGLKVRVYIRSTDILIAGFTLIQMPGCCGICISTSVYTEDSYKKRGVNKILNNMRIDIAKYSGYGIIMCTDRENNKAERKTLEANGWKDLYFFTNPRTGNLINLTIKELYYE